MKKQVFALLLSAVLAVSAAPAVWADGGEELTTVRVVVPHSLETLDDAYWYAALYNGYFEEEGIDLQILPMNGDYCAQVATGGAEVCGPAPSAMYPALASGMDLVGIYQLSQQNIFGFAVLEDSPIKEWKDLEGASICTWAEGYMLSDPILNAVGVDPSTVEYVAAYEQRAPLLQAGTVDSAFTWEMEWEMWDAQGDKGLRYFDGEEVLPMISNCFAVSRDFYENNKELIGKLGRAISKGIYFCECNPEAGAAISLAKFPGLGLTIEEAVPSVKAMVKIQTNSEGNHGTVDFDKAQTALHYTAEYAENFSEEDFDIHEIYHMNEFADEFDNFDHDAVKADAEGLDLDNIAW